MRDGETEYLKLLGERVRTARAQRGMTRRLLARDSGVSERYLAQLEVGQGNISIALLRKVAQAMGIPLADLARDEPEPPLELRLLTQSLSRLAPQELVQVRRLLGERFGSVASDRKRRIALVGLRGAGKSTLGRRLAEHLDVPFLELDREIERESGLALAEIFDLYGQAAFRRHERRALETLLQRHPRAVIATGGSLVSEPATFDLLLSSCFTVWIKAAPEEHMARVVAQGDLRPMADNAESMDDLRRILAGRTALYAKADAVVDTAGRDADTSLADLVAALA
jgi:XRE family aerobic/anaerobic benzoate catabolism transcriptional regulator